MSTEKATAIVLRTTEFSETSLVVSLFTREFGKVGALAKGARRLKGPFESALDLLAVCRIVFLRKTSDALDLVTEAKLLRRFRPAGRDLAGLYAGYYVAELLGELTEDDDPHPEVFDLADDALAAFAAGDRVGRRVLRFELALLRTIGLLPSLDVCAGCGCRVPSGRRVAFGHLDGGVLCAACRAGRTTVASVEADVINAMRRLAEPDDKAWQTAAWNVQTGGRLRGVMNHYMAHLIGRRPRLQPYLTCRCE
ncbi:MAG: DNA repair protein RecO [Pirellulales bacterium]|nr:DNA repair protein RecO [Pirellulales bacterium]